MRYTVDAAQLRTLEIHAETADIRVISADDVTEATVEITGHGDRPQERFVDGTWTLRLPRGPVNTVVGRSGTYVTRVGNVSGGTVIQAGNVTSSVIFNGSGDMFIGGRVQGGHMVIAQQDPVVATVTIPHHVNLTTRLGSGSVDTVSAAIGTLDHHGSSGDLRAGQITEAYVNTASGDVDISHLISLAAINAASGDIEVEGGTNVRISTASGDIAYYATSDATVAASSSSGDIRIRRQGNRVAAQLHTISGDITERP